MTDVTILTTTKAFAGLFRTIQTNSLSSWRALEPRPEVIVFGDEPGASTICHDLGLRHVPKVATTDQGTPLVSDMFRRGQDLASASVVCWSNADVLFTDRLNELARLVAAAPAPIYAVGRRIDIDVNDLLDLTEGWQDRLLAKAASEGELKPVNWIDWFMFPSGFIVDLPDFAIGRPGYDQWLIWQASQLGATVLDATAFVPAVHQRHDYSHVGSRALAFRGREARMNQGFVEHWSHYHSIAHARVQLDENGRIAPATDALHRLARPRRAVGHAARFTVPIRQRLLGERGSRRSRRPT